MLENEEFTGAHVKVPMEFYERLAVAAENHHQRRSTWVDMTTFDGTMSAISRWLVDLEQARTMPTPHAEAGDLLVKLGRAEFWTFTVHGWRELAPIELAVDEGRRQTVEFVHEAADRDFLVGPSEAVRAGWDHVTSEQVQTDEPHTVAYKTSFRERFGRRSIVEEALDRVREPLADYGKASAVRDTRYDWPPAGWPAAIHESLAELLELQNAVDSVIGAAERRDLGVDERLTAFRDGLDHARVTLLTIATRHAAQGAE